MEVNLPKVTCPYCGYTWVPNKPVITRCRKCNRCFNCGRNIQTKAHLKICKGIES